MLQTPFDAMAEADRNGTRNYCLEQLTQSILLDLLGHARKSAQRCPAKAPTSDGGKGYTLATECTCPADSPTPRCPLTSDNPDRLNLCDLSRIHEDVYLCRNKTESSKSDLRFGFLKTFLKTFVATERGQGRNQAHPRQGADRARQLDGGQDAVAREEAGRAVADSLPELMQPGPHPVTRQRRTAQPGAGAVRQWRS